MNENLIFWKKNTEKYKTFSIPVTKEVKRTDKIGGGGGRGGNNKNRDLWQFRHQILLIILLNESIKLNVNMDMIIKKVKHVKLNTKFWSVS